MEPIDRRSLTVQGRRRSTLESLTIEAPIFVHHSVAAQPAAASPTTGSPDAQPSILGDLAEGSVHADPPKVSSSDEAAAGPIANTTLNLGQSSITEPSAVHHQSTPTPATSERTDTSQPKPTPNAQTTAPQPRVSPPQTLGPLGRPRRGETWSEIIERVGNEIHDTITVTNDDGTLELRRITLKEGLIRAAYTQALKGNPKVLEQLMRRMPHPRTGLPEGDVPTRIEVSDWRTEAIKLIESGRLTPERALRFFGPDRARELFRAASKPFIIEGQFSESE